MTLWAYHTELLSNGSAEEIQNQIINLFDDLGVSGWELVSLVSGDRTSERIVAVFKKKIE